MIRISHPPVSGFALLLSLLASPALFAAPAASTADQAFVAKVSQGGAYEVEASKIAAQKASLQNVKDQAATEVHDHTLVNEKLKSIATATGVPISSTLNAEFQARLKKLQSTPQGSFDAAYVADMNQIHDKDEKLFALEAQQGSESYKGFAHETDGIVKRHIGALNTMTSN